MTDSRSVEAPESSFPPKKAYEATIGAIVLARPLKAWAVLILREARSLEPIIAMYVFAPNSKKNQFLVDDNVI